ncbi:carbon storage regulator [Pseudomonas palleroniana]
MRIITLKTGSAGQIGSEIKIRVLAIRGKCVQLGFEAPRDIHIFRSELCLPPDKPKRQ